MKKILLAALGILGFGIATTAGFVQSGVIDVAADTPHSPIVYRLIEWARERSIARRVAEIVPPADLSDASRIRRGAGNYDAMCTSCHLSPGEEDSEIRKGLYPRPPNLSKATEDGDSARKDARRFWIIKHGIKASGMPAWSKGGMEDAAIWDLTAFLKALPNLSSEAYRWQVEASGGHSHGGREGQGSSKEAKPEQRYDAKPDSHEHGTHQH